MTPTRDRHAVLRFGRRSAVALVLASVAGLVMFLWPLFTRPAAGVAHDHDAPFSFAVLLPILIAILLAEMTDGGIDSKGLAMLGVLSAIGAALRPLGAGTAGIELVFFLLILAGRAYGAGFGFVLGATTMFASALLTAGVGPWLPFQMMAAGWVGLGAGLLPPASGRREIALLSAYGAVSAYVYGFLTNMWFWPFTVGAGTQVSFVPGASVVSNLRRFVAATLATSTFGWDTGRAITNVVAIVLVGSPALVMLRRAARRAAFDAPVEFDLAPSVVANSRHASKVT